MSQFWSVNYQPASGDRVYLSDVDTDTAEGRSSFHDNINTALDSGATQIQTLLNLLGGGEPEV